MNTYIVDSVLRQTKFHKLCIKCMVYVLVVFIRHYEEYNIRELITAKLNSVFMVESTECVITSSAIRPLDL